MRRAVCLGLVFGFLVSTTCAAEKPSEFFRTQVEPILVGRCLGCHGTDRKGGLDLRTKATMQKGGENGPVLEPGKPDESLLFDFVSSGEMPPKNPLSVEEIAILKRWISAGGYYPDKPLDPFSTTTDKRAGYDWWSLKPLVKPVLPTPVSIPESWKNNLIDRFIDSKLAEKGLKPNGPADRRTLIRRATYDLTGLPPTPEEIVAFESDQRPDAYERVIDRLLESKHYGEQWGRHWLDVVRFGESNGFERNVIHNSVWPFRDYVIRSFNDDKPFNQFVLEHLAGDVLGPDDPNIAIGTAFLVCGPYDNVGNQDVVAAAQIRANTIDEIIRATSGAFLGMTVGCSRCHDHKFDPISQKDYYRLYSTFAGVRHGERTLRTKQGKQQQLELAKLEQQIADIEVQLREFEPRAIAGRTRVLDDGTQGRTKSLQPSRGRGVNPAGTQRGYRDDPGDEGRSPNISRGMYQWWDNQTGVDFFRWDPATSGEFRIWLSWGCGYPTHSPDAQYFLDSDGDLETKNDQTLIATIDQRRFASSAVTPLPKQPLWSGFHDAGVHELTQSSCVVLRGGRSGDVVTADVIVLQEKAKMESNASEKLSQPRFRSPVNAKVNSERINPIKARSLRFTVTATNSAAPCLDELEVWTAKTGNSPSKNIATAKAGGKATSSGNFANNPKHKLEHINDGQYGNSKSWISNTNGSGWVQIDFADEQLIDHIVWGRDREGTYADRLPTSYKIEVATQPGKWTVVASSQDRLPLGMDPMLAASPLLALSEDQLLRARPLARTLKQLRGEVRRLQKTSGPLKWWVGNFQQVNGPFHVFVGGSPQRNGAEVTPASLHVLTQTKNVYTLKSTSADQNRRFALGKWLVADENPLTPRVLVNRMWHYHFGTGIVNTPSDFGFMGGRPSHPELLDWLAIQLKANGWRLKPLHKIMMLSQTYRQSSVYRERAAKIDGDSRLLWRFPPRRLSGEEIRDAVLSISGKLDTRMGGLGFRLFRYVQDNVATYHPLDKHGPETYRRAVYHHHARAMQIDLMTEFDTPDCAFSTPRRSVTTTPLQALTMMNHSFTLDMAGFLAKRLEEDCPPADKRAQVSRAFVLSFGRAALPEEIEASVDLIEKHGLKAFCRAIFNANELIYVN